MSNLRDFSPIDSCVQESLAGLTTLITQAVRASDDSRVADLDRVLRSVERLASLVQSGTGSQYAVNENQARYAAVPMPWRQLFPD